MEHSKVAIYGALIANAAIAVLKFIASFFTGSSAMLSEGIHSSVDAVNQLLLLLGISRSKKPADDSHPFGHGKEIYFWSLIVAVLIFGLGGGMSIYEGIKHIQHPEPLSNIAWNYWVIAGAIVFEGISFVIAIKKFNKDKHNTGSFFKRIRFSKDPSLFVVIFEDGAALGGLFIALIGVFVGSQFDMPFADGLASVLIGVLLVIVAIIMVIESRKLLLGESVAPYIVEELCTMIKADKDVTDLRTPLTMHMGPYDVLLALDVHFTKNHSAESLAEVIRRLELNIKTKFPEIKRIYIEARNLAESAK